MATEGEPVLPDGERANDRTSEALDLLRERWPALSVLVGALV